jgi:uncharacterized protein (TIGR02466 family)|tara:strand:- start:1644 stop:2324 length:681 start_codon:yes stop_codon:yes gene_type:complete
MIEQLFPTPVGIYELERNITTKELDYIKGLNRRANMYNETSSSNYILNDCKELKSIKEFIQSSLNEYVSKTISPTEDVSTYITQSWTNYTQAGQAHQEHRHHNSMISGVFYVQAVEQRDNVLFHKPGVDELPMKIVPKEYNIFNSNSWEYIVTTGQLYLFPSHLSHGVPEVGAGAGSKMPTAKDQDGNYIQGSTRISLSFNTWCEGIVGINNNLDELVLEKSNQYE